VCSSDLLESTAEVFLILINEGPAGLIRFLKEKVEALKETMMEQIRTFVTEKIIVAGIKWIIGLLNPAGAFIKACMAIYDIVMFFVNSGQRIMALVNAVIDSVTNIAQGNLEGAASWIENALAKGVPIAISFLASLLGLDGIGKKIQQIIEKIQAPINLAIDWLILQAVKLVKAAGGLLSGAFGKKDQGASAKTTKLDDPSGVKAVALSQLEEVAPKLHTIEDYKKALGSIETGLRPQGLKTLQLGPNDEDGSHAIYAEASPKKKIGITVPKGRKVTMDVTIEMDSSKPPLADADVPVYKHSTMVNGKLVDVTPDRIPLHPAQPGRGASRAKVGGFVTTLASAVSVKTWNTGDIDPSVKSNASHAEPQFTQWFMKQPREWLARVRGVNVTRLSWSTCDACAADLREIPTKLEKIGNKLSKNKFKLHSTKLYPNEKFRAKEGQPEGWTVSNGPKETPDKEEQVLKHV
jgi:hypothetical protein